MANSDGSTHYITRSHVLRVNYVAVAGVGWMSNRDADNQEFIARETMYRTISFSCCWTGPVRGLLTIFMAINYVE